MSARCYSNLKSLHILCCRISTGKDMGRPFLHTILRPFGRIEQNELFTTLLMFCYSFMAMTAYNIIQPIQRSLFIEDLGADKIPYVQLAAGTLIGVIMSGYTWLMSRLPRRWSLPITQAGIAALLVAFWFLFQTGHKWVSAAFYIAGLILGILLISQFWTLANVVYNPRQAKRLFGFIGGGASLGGTLGALITWFSKEVGTVNLLLISASFMLICMTTVILIVRREHVGEQSLLPAAEEKKGVGVRRAVELLQQSKHLRLIALVICFGAIGAAVIDQQLNMATQAFKSQGGRDAMTAFLGQVRVYMSFIGFLIQITLTSRIHRYLGVGFALLLLPMGVGSTAAVILLNAALWAPAFARILDQSLRYTVDKTTREILYMPLPDEIKYEAKPFVDVTLDRFAKGLTAVLLLVLISSWGFGLGWQKLSYVSLALTGIWIIVAVRAKHGYRRAFRQSIETRQMKPLEMRLPVADPSTLETLIQELASPDEGRVLYAIDMLESLDKRNLITPLLLHHESVRVRVRALGIVAGILPDNSTRWLPAIQRMMSDESPEVRAAAVGALANIRDQQTTMLVLPYLQDSNPRIAMTAAMVLSASTGEEDAAAAEEVLRGLVFDTRESASQTRLEFAVAMRHVPTPHFRRLLIPLLHDTNAEVAEEAMRSVRQLGAADFIFVPTLVSLLRSRRLKSSSRDLLVGYGEPVLSILNHFLRDPEEDIWVRRHIPATIALIPCQKAMDILTAALSEPDGFLRFKILAAIERLHRTDSGLKFNREVVESLALKEGEHFFLYRTLYRRLFERESVPKDSLIVRALGEKIERSRDRVYRLLGLLYPWKDMAAAQRTIRHGDARSRSAALEYLDNVLAGTFRKRLMSVLEEPAAGGDGREIDGLRTEDRGDIEATIPQLIDDDDPVLSAAAVLLVWQSGLGGLQEKLERVLATRDARDWYVFEAASWVCAAFRLKESGRRALWNEPIPTVEVAERLGRLPLFAALSVDGLFRIAGAGNQVRIEPGRVLHEEGAVPETLHFLLDGRVHHRAPSGAGREVAAPAALGFPEIFEGRPMSGSIRTAGAAACLILSGEEFRTLLADDTELAQGLFRTLCASGDATAASLVFRGRHKQGKTAIPGADMKLIEKVLILKDISVFAEVSAEEMPGLASIAAEVRLRKGTKLFAETDAPTLHALVTGEISLESPGEGSTILAGPNDAIGIQHTLGGIPLGCSARVLQDGTALRIDREDLFDLIAQRPDLMRQLFAAMFRKARAGMPAMGK